MKKYRKDIYHDFYQITVVTVSVVLVLLLSTLMIDRYFTYEVKSVDALCREQKLMSTTKCYSSFAE